MWHWVVIAVLLVLVVLLWLARYFVHAELMWICEKEFAELENYEEKQKNGKIIEGQKRKMEEIKTNEQPIMPVKAL